MVAAEELIAVSYGAPFIYLSSGYPGYRSLSTFETFCGNVSNISFKRMFRKCLEEKFQKPSF